MVLPEGMKVTTIVHHAGGLEEQPAQHELPEVRITCGEEIVVAEAVGHTEKPIKDSLRPAGLLPGNSIGLPNTIKTFKPREDGIIHFEFTKTFKGDEAESVTFEVALRNTISKGKFLRYIGKAEIKMSDLNDEKRTFHGDVELMDEFGDMGCILNVTVMLAACTDENETAIEVEIAKEVSPREMKTNALVGKEDVSQVQKENVNQEQKEDVTRAQKEDANQVQKKDVNHVQEKDAKTPVEEPEEGRAPAQEESKDDKAMVKAEDGKKTPAHHAVDSCTTAASVSNAVTENTRVGREKSIAEEQEQLEEIALVDPEEARECKEGAEGSNAQGSEEKDEDCRDSEEEQLQELEEDKENKDLLVQASYENATVKKSRTARMCGAFRKVF